MANIYDSKPDPWGPLAGFLSAASSIGDQMRAKWRATDGRGKGSGSRLADAQTPTTGSGATQVDGGRSAYGTIGTLGQHGATGDFSSGATGDWSSPNEPANPGITARSVGGGIGTVGDGPQPQQAMARATQLGPDARMEAANATMSASQAAHPVVPNAPRPSPGPMESSIAANGEVVDPQAAAGLPNLPQLPNAVNAFNAFNAYARPDSISAQSYRAQQQQPDITAAAPGAPAAPVVSQSALQVPNGSAPAAARASSSANPNADASGGGGGDATYGTQPAVATAPQGNGITRVGNSFTGVGGPATTVAPNDGMTDAQRMNAPFAQANRELDNRIAGRQAVDAAEGQRQAAGYAAQINHANAWQARQGMEDNGTAKIWASKQRGGTDAFENRRERADANLANATTAMYTAGNRDPLADMKTISENRDRSNQAGIALDQGKQALRQGDIMNPLAAAAARGGITSQATQEKMAQLTLGQHEREQRMLDQYEKAPPGEARDQLLQGIMSLRGQPKLAIVDQDTGQRDNVGNPIFKKVAVDAMSGRFLEPKGILGGGSKVVSKADFAQMAKTHPGGEEALRKYLGTNGMSVEP